MCVIGDEVILFYKLGTIPPCVKRRNSHAAGPSSFTLDQKADSVTICSSPRVDLPASPPLYSRTNLTDRSKRPT